MPLQYTRIFLALLSDASALRKQTFSLTVQNIKDTILVRKPTAREKQNNLT